jgi:hypothetical protein
LKKRDDDEKSKKRGIFSKVRRKRRSVKLIRRNDQDRCSILKQEDAVDYL